MDVSVPVRKEIRVRVAPERAFDIFFTDMASWWPLGTHSVHGAEAALEVIPGPDGRIVERYGGEEVEWARFLVWEPPGRVVMSWHPNPERSHSTEVEVRFVEDGDGTRVELEHRGWERIGELGDQIRGEYATGWDPVLDRYAAAT